MSPSDYLAWYNSDKNPLIKTVQKEGVELGLKLETQDYLSALNREEPSQPATESSLDFDFRVSSIKKTELLTDVLQRKFQAQPGLSLETLLAFGLKEKIKAYTASDTLNCSLFHQVRNYDLAPYIDFSLGFSVDEKASKDLFDKGFKVAIDLSDLGLGTVTFNYTGSDFGKVPELDKTN